MRVKTLLVAAIGMALALVLTRLTLLEVHHAEGRQLDGTQLDVERVARDSAALLVLSQEYLLHQSPRARQQWRAVHAELLRTLPLVAQGAPGVQAQVLSLQETAQGLPDLFGAFDAARGALQPGLGDGRLDTLADQLVAETRRISDGAFVVAEHLIEERGQKEQANRTATRATMAAVFGLMLTIAVLVMRRVLRPMAGLEATAQAVRQGDLAARSRYSARDEFGDLSRTFDAMTQTLQERSASLEAALRDNEALLSTLHLHAIVSVADRAGRIVDINDRFCQISGYRRDELLGQNHRIVNSAVHDRAFWQDMWGTIAAGKPWRGEICNRAKDGSLYWVDSLIAPFVGADGRIEKFISIRTDVTAARRAEQRLRASQSFLDRTGRVAGVGGWTLELATGAIEWTDQTCRLHEVPPGHRPTLEEALNFYAPEARATISSAVEQAVATGGGWDLVLPFITATGRRIWVRAIGEVETVDGKAVRLVGALQDVSARMGLEAALREQVQLMSSVLENLPCGLSVFNAELELVAANTAYRRLLGFPDALFDAAKPRFEDFIRYNAERGEYGGDDIEATVRGIVERASAPAVPHQFERLRPNGVPVEVRGAPMPAGGFVTTYTDISERKRAQQLLQQAHDRFEIAADSAGIGVWEYDPVRGTLDWDERMHRLYGLQPAGGEVSDVSYASWVASIHPEDRPRCEAAFAAALRGEADFEPDFRVVLPDGELRYLKANAQIARDAAGVPLRMTGVNIDISERKRAEAALRATSSLLGTVLESASEVSIIAIDPRMKITVFNAGAERLLGYRADEVVGRATPGLIHDAAEIDARAAELSAELGRPLHGSAVFTDPSTLRQPHEWTYVRKDGSRVRVSLVVTAMHDAEGGLSGYLGIAHDVTRQKEYEESLREAMHKARQASRAKSHFLANMSHEIRTPMNAVIGLSYLLGQTPLDAQQSDFLAKLRVASKQLLALINDILDLSKVEAGELTVEHAPFTLRHLLKDLADVAAMQADARHIGFEIDAPATLPAVLMGDVTRLHQVLGNLLSNAVKFTEQGRVTLRVRAMTAAAGMARLRFEVQDSGIGISPEDQARLFAPFVQADASMTRRFGGTGLGLSIVKRLVELMGGKVSLTSTPGVGSEFGVELSFYLAADTAAAPLSAPAPSGGDRGLPGVQVLVADDSDINLDVAKRILELEGAIVTLAVNGQQAVELLLASAQAFDVVLMDVQMPVLDGYEATRRIRGAPALAGLPVIALTAGALTGERQRASAVGMSDFVTKPFEPRELVRCIRRHLRADTLQRMATQLLAPAPARSERQDATPWPAIEGIDSHDACERLGGDWHLFRSMLRRLLGEFADIADGIDTADAAALPALAGRLHKLRGSASMLGMKAIQQVAADGETACRAGDAATGLRQARRVHGLLKSLAETAAWLLEETADTAATPAALHPLEPAALAGLVELLRQQSLAALEQFQALAPQLRRTLGDALFQRVSAHVDNLQFDAAAQLLDSGRAEGGPTAMAAD